jgi:carbon monoxide dehydrogenase subunit G
MMKQKTLVSVLWAVLMLIPVVAQAATAEKKQVLNKEYDLGPFSAINVSTAVDVVFTPSADSHCTIMAEGTAMMVDRLQVKVDDDVLTIKLQSDTKYQPKREYLKVYVSAPTLKSVNVKGASSMEIAKLHTPKLKIDVSGASSLSAKLIDAEQLSVELSGASSAKFDGTATMAKLTSVGASNLKAESLLAAHVSAVCSGASKISCYASRSVEANATGASSITVKGNPTQTNVVSSGASNVKINK